MNIDWAVVASLALLCYIIYAILIPPIGLIRRRREEMELNEKRAARVFKRSVSNAIGIREVSYERRDMIGYLTTTKHALVWFDGIAAGDYSETRFVHVKRDGTLATYKHESEAQAVFQEGDYGISAVTMAEGVIQFRDIVPNLIDHQDAYKLRYSFVLGSK